MYLISSYADTCAAIHNCLPNFVSVIVALTTSFTALPLDRFQLQSFRELFPGDLGPVPAV